MIIRITPLLENSRKITFFQRLKTQTSEIQKIKGVKRGNSPLFPSEAPPAALRSEPPLPFSTYRNMPAALKISYCREASTWVQSFS